MTTLVWDQSGERTYETGIDHGVLYLADGSGIPWNGLTSVEDDFSDTSVTPYYYDGVVYVNSQSNSDFAMTLKAFTYPDEFSDYIGISDIEPGLLITAQSFKPFGLSYRTLKGTDTDSEAGYKLHILYNLTADPDDQTYQTLNASPEALEFSWKLQGIPIDIDGFAPAMHFIIDSTEFDSDKLAELEDVLYGANDISPKLPSFNFIKNWLVGGHLITITDNGDGTWAAETAFDNLFTMIDATTFEINEVDATYLDANTYTVSTTD